MVFPRFFLFFAGENVALSAFSMHTSISSPFGSQFLHIGE
jgi:hypothetical protein